MSEETVAPEPTRPDPGITERKPKKKKKRKPKAERWGVQDKQVREAETK